MTEIPTRYNPQEVERKWYDFWERGRLFHVEPDPSRRPFCIVIPPPNITGILHMGHALNNTIQDIMVRYRRMQGYCTLWVPGTDHAGIATQNVVERKLAQQGQRRQDLGRERFLEEVWKWKQRYGSTIIEQLKRLGCSCDWERERFTMDEGLSRAVLEVFVRLFEAGLIYRGNYIVNWCPRCQTALSDEEAPHKEIEGKLYYIRYPIDGSKDGFVTVATTRPETMLGDVAVAVNPKDKRFRQLCDKLIILPIKNRKLKVIKDGLVDPSFGTGIVKITPAHDSNDFEISRRHRLEPILVMDPDGKMNRNAGRYEGMDRFACRQAVLEDLKKEGLLEKDQPHRHALAHCYRCDTIVEPYLSKQWFVKMKPLAGPAIKVVKEGKIKFYPRRWTKVYLNWMENIRDWCISRQIWWGHRLPVYYCRGCQVGKSEIRNLKSETNSKFQILNSKPDTDIIVSRTKPDRCPRCGSTDIVQDEDVLDTWFSSWLWPFSVFGWPSGHIANGKSRIRRHKDDKDKQLAISDKLSDLDYFYPTSVLVTAPEILFFWVARMIMSGLKFMKKIPFSDVYIHGTVRDIKRRKMSKSLGNIIDPLEIIQAWGADALRFSLIYLAGAGQDIFLSEEKFQVGRNFANKIWNASRFTLMNLEPFHVKADLCQFFRKENLNIANRWILSRFYSTLKKIDKAMDAYRLNEAAGLVYEFFWHEFCDWYLEMVKADINSRDSQVVLYKVLEKSLRVLHPFMPFITEEIWQRLPQSEGSIMVESWPHIQEEMIERSLERDMQLIIECISAIRNLRSLLGVAQSRKMRAIISAAEAGTLGLLKRSLKYIQQLANLEAVEVGVNLPRPKKAVSTVAKKMDIFILLESAVALDEERKRIARHIREAERELEAKKEKLKNKDFLKKAPKEVVEQQKARKLELSVTLKKLKQILDELE
jgi:valyl-tRNA synthetase